MKVFYQNRNELFHSRITLNNTYPAHIHQYIELIYVTEGSITVQINGKSRTLQAGDLSVCFPNNTHSTRSTGTSAAILILFHPDAAIGFTNEFYKMEPSAPFICANNLPVEAAVTIRRLNSLSGSGCDKRIIQGYLYVLLGLLLPQLQLTDTRQKESADTCQQILEYVNHHYEEDISLTSVARALGYNSYYISHIFSSRLKTTFPAYVGHCRCEHACKLLTESTLSVTEIGYASGFRSSRTFYRTFVAIYNTSPLNYRRHHR